MREKPVEDKAKIEGADDSCVLPPAQVRAELRRILESKHFSSCRRGKEFLRFIVEQSLDGNGDLLKERMIGIQVFGRKPDYSTGEDPIVRVQAGEVRRRLDSYNSEPERTAEITIQLPLGNYAPVFIQKQDTALPVESGALFAYEPKFSVATIPPPATGGNPAPLTDAAFAVEPVRAPGRRQWLSYRRALIALLFALAVAVPLLCVLLYQFWGASPDRFVRAFWAPALNSPHPLVLWMPKPMLYRPSDELFQRYGKAHANALVSRVERRNELLPLQPEDALLWRDIVPVTNAGPAIGGVVAAMHVGRLLTEQKKRYELRFGQEASYAELRESPAVIVGGQNTPWSPELVSGLHFVFDDVHGEGAIRETVGAQRAWIMEAAPGGRSTRDYGLITRELSSRSGQFLIQVAGISDIGTEAAADFLDSPKELSNVLQNARVDLNRKNLQILISTDITDEKAGPPHVIAVSSW